MLACCGASTMHAHHRRSCYTHSSPMKRKWMLIPQQVRPALLYLRWTAIREIAMKMGSGLMMVTMVLVTVTVVVMTC